VSQRLVRKICTKCVVERKITESEIEFLQKKAGLSADSLVEKYGQKNVKYGKGCEACRKTGYSGRTVISEVLVVNEKIREMIVQKHSPDDIRKTAVGFGMTLLAGDAVEKVFLGKTTFEEISSVVL
jgi:type IV pilus assembly protein PilB